MPSDNLIELSALGIYLALLLAIGISSARNIKTSEDFTLARRQVTWFVLLATTAATMLGGGSSIGSVGNVYKIGIAAAVIVCAWHIQLIFTGLFVAPRLRRLNLITVGDYFELKFGRLARDFSTLHCVIFLVGACAAQMVGMGTIMTAVLGIDYGVALLIASAVTVFYSTVGGIRAVVRTDVLQFVILVGGLGAAAAILFVDYGGFSGIMAQVGEERFQLTSNWSAIHLTGLFFAFLLGETFVPPYTTRCFIAKDERHSRWGVAGAGIFLLLFHPIVIFILGLSAHIDPAVNAQAAGDVQLALPAVVRMLFHPVIAGILVAALMAAVMSSADSTLSSLAAIAMEDIFRRHINSGAADDPGRRCRLRCLHLLLRQHHRRPRIYLRLLGTGHGRALSGRRVLVQGRPNLCRCDLHVRGHAGDCRVAFLVAVPVAVEPGTLWIRRRRCGSVFQHTADTKSATGQAFPAQTFK